MGKFVGGMRLYIPINRVGGERGAQSFAINSWSFAIRAATVPNRAEKYYRGWRVVIYSATLYYREWYVLSGLSSPSRFSSFPLTSLVWSIIAFFLLVVLFFLLFFFSIFSSLSRILKMLKIGYSGTDMTVHVINCRYSVKWLVEIFKWSLRLCWCCDI